MKKRIAMILVTAMVLSLTACGKTQGGNESVESSSAVAESVAIEVVDSLELLNTVWGSYEDANKFPVGGGDSANLNFEGPGKFDAANVEELDVTLGFPAAEADKIDDAASMMNAMMANNFTAGVYRVTDEANVQAVADALKDNILARQWMCGMPEKMVVVSAGNYVISVFGLNDFVDPFVAKVQENYEAATVLYEEAIS